MNNVTLIGRMTKDAELRATQSGKTVASFTLAVDRRKQGETDFIPCVAWEKTAEILAKYAKKGKLIAVGGSLQTRQYEAKDGTKRTVYEVVVDEVKLLSPKEQTGAFDEPMQPAESEDIPF